MPFVERAGAAFHDEEHRRCTICGMKAGWKA
jgi:hypothetical protein